jgi:acyl-CoA synthetase (AMP-forming)/AMP-acid ligase II
VVGAPHLTLGEELVAVVVTDGALTRRELHAAAASVLRREHLPRRWFIVDALPLSPAGKVRRADVAHAVGAGSLSTVPPPEPAG